MRPVERLFLALWPDDPARRALADAQRHWRWPDGAAPVAPEKLHLTLHFLGPVRPEAIGALRAHWPAAPAPVDLVLDRAQLWPDGIAALVPRTLPAPLSDLHLRLADVLWNGGLRVEARRFRPHVTMARGAAGAVPPALPEPIAWTVRGYVLVRSDTATGRYTLVERVD